MLHPPCRLSFLWKQRYLEVLKSSSSAPVKDITRQFRGSNSNAYCCDPVPPSCPPCRPMFPCSRCRGNHPLPVHRGELIG
ncbi:hypothetical protein CHARACLAT_003296 [Characodon lateralis]|uniref:Uncharacterized protein n=1 Tax=Characodon lateralis TaxID=208331 RepID=A0ABU7E6N8_9TELE|nr:hypothetical protein [Characodon lateralis]